MRKLYWYYYGSSLLIVVCLPEFDWFENVRLVDRTINKNILVPCIYGHTYNSKSMDQPGKVANPARGQLNREN